MSIFLDREIVAELVHKQFGGFDQLAADWEALSIANPNLPRPKSRTSLYRWLTEGVPVKRTADRYLFLMLSGILNVDPLCIFDFERNGYFSNFTKIRQLIYLTDPRRTFLAPVFDLYRPGEHWPSAWLAERYLGKKWRSRVFSNDETYLSHHYGLVKLDFNEAHRAYPKAMHIAYRRKNFPDKMWRYYGCVIGYKDYLKLYSESGAFQSMPSVKNNEIRFRTYFGGRLVEFKVASLHDFNLNLEWPFDDDTVIGFEW